jgi:CRISPR-associated endoribonuclease Cas6
MLHRFEVQGTFGGQQRVHSAFGSLLHGALIQQLPEDMQQMLHQTQVRPFAQHVLPTEGQGFVWHIGVWQDALADAVAGVVKPGGSLMLTQKDAAMDIHQVSHACVSEAAWMAPFMTGAQVHRLYELSFVTPCTHKSEGQYALFPTPALIVGSLCRRFSETSDELRLDDEDTMDALARHMRITRYALRSAAYSLEGVRVQGYVGWITLFIAGPEQLARLAGAVLSFAEYAGVGIKTALGMGGCSVRALPKQPAQSAPQEE